jgi:hypothetical protein
MHFSLLPNDKARLLIAIMRHFRGDGSFISLEGTLSSFQAGALDNSIATETAELKRNTVSPVLDFVVAPLSAHNVEVVSRAVLKKDLLSEGDGVIHVQIASAGRLVFGAYDNFHPDCVFVAGIDAPRLTVMKEENLLTAFVQRDA